MSQKLSWMNGSTIIYHIFIDRFACFNPATKDDKPTWVGGTIAGVIEKLSYLSDLGVNCILLSPFFEGRAYHGYHITNFYEVDSHFGDKQVLKKLVDSCHKLKIRIVIDFVANHCSKEHPFFVDAQSNGKSRYRSWFSFTNWPGEYLTFLNYKELPKLNLDNPETREYITENALYWLNEFNFDGIRLDHAIGPSNDFWKKFRRRIRQKRKDCVLIGEVWETNKEDEAMLNYVGILDGCLDFTFNKLIKNYLIQGPRSKKSEAAFRQDLKDHYSKFPKDFLLPTFLDNHDMNRFLFEMVGDKSKLKWAATLQFGLKQPKIIYYGTEVGLSQTKSIVDFSNYGDLQARKKMIWDSNHQDKTLLKFYKDLCNHKPTF